MSISADAGLVATASPVFADRALPREEKAERGFFTGVQTWFDPGTGCSVAGFHRVPDGSVSILIRRACLRGTVPMGPVRSAVSGLRAAPRDSRTYVRTTIDRNLSVTPSQPLHRITTLQDGFDHMFRTVR